MKTLESGPLLLARDGGIATLSFNRPQAMNALDVPSARAFLQACQWLSEDASVRVVVLRGEGRAFGAGGDLASMRADPAPTARTLIESLHGGIKLLAAMDAPVIASLHGVVAGGSLSLSTACDLAIAAEGTRFNLAYANVAASCDLSASWSLPRIVGLRRALQIALLSETFDAAQALSLGLVHQVVPSGELAQATHALATRLAAGPTKAYGRIKRLMRQSLDNDLATQLDLEQQNFIAGTQTADFTEGLDAFTAKRAAAFKGM